jgi:hypothetical protein
MFLQYDVKPNKRLQLATDDSSLQSILRTSKDLRFVNEDSLNVECKHPPEEKEITDNKHDNYISEFVILPFTK